MKKLFALILALAMVVGVMTACDPGVEQKPAPEDPKEYIAYVSESSADAVADSIAGMLSGYATTTQVMSGNGKYNGTSATMRVQMSDMLIDMLETYTTNGMDLSFLKDISIKLDTAVKDALAQTKIGVGLNNQIIASVDMLIDQDAMDIYYGIPELTNQYLKIAGENFNEDAFVDTGMTVSYETIGRLAEAMPTEQEISKLLSKYITLYVEQIDDAQKTTETVTVDGVSQSLTVLTASFTEQDAKDGTIAILEAVQTDTDLEAICDRLSVALKEVAEENGATYNDDMFADLCIAAQEALAQLKDTPVYTDDAIAIKMYVDGNHELVGLKMGDENDNIYFMTVSDGGKFAHLTELDTVKITGSGTTSNGISNGTFRLTESGDEYLIVEVRNYNPDMNRDGKTALDLVLTPGKALLEAMDMDNAVLTALGGTVSLGVKLESNGTDAVVAYDVMLGGQSFVKLDVTSTMTNSNVSIPQNVADATDDTAVMLWFSNMDLQKLVESMKAAGIPEELLSELIGSVMKGGF